MNLSKPMGTQLLLFLQLPTPPFTSLPLLNLNKPLNTTSTTNNIVSCSSTGSHQTGRQFRFDPQDSDDDDEFEFTSAAKQRIWWSDFDDYEMMSGTLTRMMNSGFASCYIQVFRAFGWMLPAIVISLLLGTVPNAFIMALAVPLGQSALSLVFDKVSGKASKSWKSTSRAKAKKKHFTRSANNVRRNKGKQEANKTGGEKARYSSWLCTDGGLRDKDAKRVPKLGGWDQLDDQVEAQKRAPSQGK
ncbi:hypothetical protein CRYUN_Cryun05aG0033100 [Craigia yunnanensis]